MPNRLAAESSPYLRQHADNPVDWWPWCDEAFEEARRRDIPLLVSIGYSACHWCHVMAHESFRDPDVAALMNRLFVNVKVDREERPDVDALYMRAVQALLGSGGWPLTVFVTPAGRPFYGGTYFPPVERQGLASFSAVCLAVDEAWRGRRGQLMDQAARLIDAISRTASAGDRHDELPGPEVIEQACADLSRTYDPEWGGFGPAPKFPRADALALLLRAHAHDRSSGRLEMVATTLDAMASGGIYDHLGGGFARYSTDRTWSVPHFEKMLYDQALLARVYLNAWQLTGRASWLQVACETIEAVLRDMRVAGGGFASSLDADSDGVEGAFYLWRHDELVDVTGADAPAAIDWYGVTPEGNFEGANVLHRQRTGELIRPPEIERARRSLFEARERRPHPGLDDKVLTEWNALFVSTLAEAAAVVGSTRWAGAAVDAAGFMLENLRRDDGRWMRAWHPQGSPRTPAFAGDYATLVDSFVRLNEATGDRRWIGLAVQTADALLDLFWDPIDGGLLTNGRDGESLAVDLHDVLDNATPSSNSMAAWSLTRLAALTGSRSYEERAADLVRKVADPLVRHPTAFGFLLPAVDLLHDGAVEIVVTGDRPDLLSEVRRRYLPDAVVAWGDRWPSPLWEGRRDGFAYVCERYVCKAPVDTPEGLAAMLER